MQVAPSLQMAIDHHLSDAISSVNEMARLATQYGATECLAANERDLHELRSAVTYLLTLVDRAEAA